MIVPREHCDRARLGDVNPSPLRDAVVAYADRLHRALPGGHRVTSPLGAWLVLALAAPAASGETRAELEAVLGLPVADAAAGASRLLADPHPAVVAAAAAWVRDVVRTPALEAWLGALPAAVERGDVPTQEAADAWASGHTLGLIEKFPLALGPETLLVLCSAIATKVSWDPPYELGGAFASWGVEHTLVSSRGHDSILATPLGDVAVHTNSADGVAVTSVIAPLGVADVDVLDFAHRIVADRDSFARRRLSDLPLGAQELWTITERDGIAGGEHYRAELPAWEAHSRHGLLEDVGTGFPAAVRTVDGLLGGSGPADAVQVALARYTRVGFEAAAVTGLARAASAMAHRPGRERTAALHFAHPYAVVATATTPRPPRPPRRQPWGPPPTSPWAGLPVFAAWVGQAVEARD